MQPFLRWWRAAAFTRPPASGGHRAYLAIDFERRPDRPMLPCETVSRTRERAFQRRLCDDYGTVNRRLVFIPGSRRFLSTQLLLPRGDRLKETEALPDPIAHGAERAEPLLLTAADRARIVEAPMNPFRVAGKRRAGLVGIREYGNGAQRRGISPGAPGCPRTSAASRCTSGTPTASPEPPRARPRPWPAPRPSRGRTARSQSPPPARRSSRRR